MTDVLGPILEVVGPKWETPVSAVPEQRVGKARLRHDTMARGYYRLEGVMGRELFKVVRDRMPLTLLERLMPPESGVGKATWKVWMVDDPLHWYGMGERVAELPPGRILCAGLGLGLMAHHLVARPDVTQVTIVEIDPDVISLMAPTLPDDKRISVVQADYYKHIASMAPADRPDAVLWDLAVGSYDETVKDFMLADGLTGAYLPGVPLLRFGERKTPTPDVLRF